MSEPRPAARVALAHAVAGAAVGLSVGLSMTLLGESPEVAPSIALAFALPAAAVGRIAAREPGELDALASSALAGGLAIPLGLAQATYLAGLREGGLDAAYAELERLGSSLHGRAAVVFVAGVIGIGAGHGLVPALLLRERRRREGPFSTKVVVEVAALAFGLGWLVCVPIATFLLGAVAALGEQVMSRGAGEWLGAPLIVFAAAGATAGPATVLLPAWAAAFAAGERLDRALAGARP